MKHKAHTNEKAINEDRGRYRTIHASVNAQRYRHTHAGRRKTRDTFGTVIEKENLRIVRAMTISKIKLSKGARSMNTERGRMIHMCTFIGEGTWLSECTDRKFGCDRLSQVGLMTCGAWVYPGMG